MPKILKPYTIIPLELYVQRDADRQVKNIISDMGRPGYVLVSRQMGKTNLLLNAKRKLETPDDVFVYVDLSNPFESSKSCFENIIDTAIETNLEKFNEVAKVIHNRRKELRDTPPHKQHTNELRLLINAIEGKLVIILDEIDALTKTQYSDQIFAQIRSIYFSRVNFKELEKLTYILSGVIEPNEIIKDPKISPFNIGQKIFLNDFSRDEFEKFITNSKLTLSQEIRDRVFYWTSGNPRMTWDVCSEVENKFKTEELTSDAIDRIVNQIYLTTFDKPPIDNIRELVSKDREIRNAIVEIEYKKGKEVSDKIKNKLYLSGIINYDENDIHIKNEIIKQSLNLEWIKTLEEADKGLIGLAFESYENGRYSEALLQFERYLEQNEFPEENRDICYYYMGYSIYLDGDYAKAIEYFNRANLEIEDSPKFHFNKENLKGLAHKHIKEYSQSRACYEYVLNNSIVDDNYLRALLNLGHLLMNKYLGDETNEAIFLFEKLIHDKLTISKKVKEKSLNYFKCVASYNLADIYRSRGEFKKAEDYILQALPITTNETKSSLLFLLSEIIEDEEQRIKILYELLDFVSENNLEEPNPSPEKPLDLDIVKVRDILLNLYNTNKVKFKEVIDRKTSLYNNKSKGELLYEVAIHSINKQGIKNGVDLLNEIIDDSKNQIIDIEPLTNYNILKILSFFTRTQEITSKQIEYLNLFAKERLAPVDYFDMEIFANIIYLLSESKKYQEALEYVNLINSARPTTQKEILINYLVIYHLELNIYFYLNNRLKAIQKAEEIILLSSDENIKQQTSNLLGETGLEIIRQNAEIILHPTSKIQSPIKSAKTYTRNQFVKVRYKDGTILETKFKKVKNDLNSGACFILN